jgi:hypothetical protein
MKVWLYECEINGVLYQVAATDRSQARAAWRKLGVGKVPRGTKIIKKELPPAEVVADGQ